jgi:hypothetical protein
MAIFPVSVTARVRVTTPPAVVMLPEVLKVPARFAPKVTAEAPEAVMVPAADTVVIPEESREIVPLTVLMAAVRLMVPEAETLIGLLPELDTAPFKTKLVPVRLTAPVVALTAARRVVPVPATCVTLTARIAPGLEVAPTSPARLRAELTVSAASAVLAPTVEAKTTLPPPAVKLRFWAPSNALVNTMFPPAVLTATGPVRVTAGV